MQKSIFAGVAALLVFCGLGLSVPAQASMLGKIGKSITYPVKKAAGNGSKVANHAGKSVAYPVKKAGENTSKTTHKVTQ